MNGVESFSYTAHDANNNTATGTITINVIDDVPLPIHPELLVGLNVAGTSATVALDSDGSSSNQTGNVDDNVGADQAGTVRFAASLVGINSGLTSGGLPIFYAVSADGSVLTGATTQGTVFTITLNHDVGPGDDTYTLNMIGAIDGGISGNTFVGGSDFVGGNTPWAGFVPIGQDKVLVNDDSSDLLLTL